MARSLRDSRLETREARLRLKPRGKPYWRLIEPGLHLGYRRLKGRSGTWCVRRYAGGQAYSVEALRGVLADDFAEADGVSSLSFAQAQRAVESKSPKPKGGALTVRAAIEQYLTHQSDSGKSIDDARYRVDALILPSLGDVALGDLTTDKLRNWLAALARAPARGRKKPVSGGEPQRQRRASANRVWTILQAALNHAWREGRVPSDSAWRRVKPFKGVTSARLRYLSVAEAQRLINACDPDLRKLVQAALQTGARYGELTRLRVHDFNPDSGTVTVGRSKSGRSRHVVLTEEGAALFARWCAGLAGNALLFTRNGEPWDKSNQQRPLRLACARAKIEPAASFHILRHSWASLAAMSGLPMTIIARNLGHSSTKMTEAFYAHLAPSYEVAAIRAHAPRFGIEADDNVVPLVRP
jgi:integrase